MNWKALWFWPEDMSGKPLKGRWAFLYFLAALVIEELVLRDPQHQVFAERHYDPVILLGVAALLGLLLFRKK